MIIKHSNNLSITDTAKVNIQGFVRTNGPVICDSIDRFFTTQAGTR